MTFGPSLQQYRKQLQYRKHATSTRIANDDKSFRVDLLQWCRNYNRIFPDYLNHHCSSKHVSNLSINFGAINASQFMFKRYIVKYIIFGLSTQKNKKHER